MATKKKTAKDATPAKIRIQYYRSGIAFPETQKRVVRCLGLRTLNRIVERPDTPSMRGADEKVPHLLRTLAQREDTIDALAFDPFFTRHSRALTIAFLTQPSLPTQT